MKKILLLIFCIALTGCVSSKAQFEEQGFGEGVFIPKYPVIFVHGLGYDGAYWRDSKTFKKLKQLGWDAGEDIRVEVKDGKRVVKPEFIKPADIYSISLSSGVLAIVQQGEELAEIIKKVKLFNRVDKVILIGHSMGGLAIREYLQSDYYKNDVAGFVSVGTPHQGSNFDLEKLTLKVVPKFFRDFVWEVDLKSDAVRDLRPKSVYLEGGNEDESPEEFKNKDINLNGIVPEVIKGLNDFEKKPLPEDIMYAVIIGSGCPLIATRTQCSWSDGVVKVSSQDLNAIPGVNVKGPVYYTEKDHFGEANDSWVLIQALKGYLVQIQ